MTTDDTDIVLALRVALADRVGKERFDLWFGPGVRLDYAGRGLTIGVPNRFFRDWIQANFRKQIEAACLEVLGKAPTLSFRMEAAADREASAAESTGSGQSADSTQSAGSSETAESTQPALRVVSAGDKSAPDGRTPQRRAGFQPRRRFASFASFVPGKANRLALASAEIAARKPGELTPLFFHGPTSVGKTHLLEAIYSAARKRSPQSRTVYLSAEQFTTQFLEALRGSGLPSFRRRYRGVALLIIDDLQFLTGKRATQIELLHTIDAVLQEGGQLVFAADRPPNELAGLGPELTTRLQSGMVCPIETPDYAMRLGIVAEMAKRLKVALPEDVRQMIASKVTTHAREISGALCRLRATSEALGEPITLALAEEALGELLRHTCRVVRLHEIERAVCDTFGLEPSSLHSNGKAKRVSHPRMLAMWLARKHTRAALSEIGQYFGRRSHSTVLSAQKRVESWMARDEQLDTAERAWTVDEAIRQVERRLAVG